MKKILCLLVSMFLLVGCSTTSNEEDGLIKGIKFGDSIESVKKAEDGTILTEIDTLLIYETTYNEKPASILYNFNTDGKLQEISCQLTSSYDDVNEYFNDFYGIRDEFTEKYGEPTLANEGTEFDATSIINGEGAYWYEWYSDDYEMETALSYDANSETFITSVNYFSPKHFNND